MNTTSIQDELDAVLERSGEVWSESEKVLVARVCSDIVELAARASLGANVGGAMKVATGSLANLHSASARTVRATALEVVQRMIRRGIDMATVALA